jgi:hypothetical protein
MKTMLLLVGMLVVCASSAFAAIAGVDLSFNACPGNAGSTQAGTIDCAGGGTLTALVTFAPAEAISDLVALDTLIDFYLQTGNITSTANFWDFETANAGCIALDHLRPGSGCSAPIAYANTWNTAVAGVSWAALVLSPQKVRMAAGAYRGNNFAAAAGQNLFGFQLSLNGSTSVEAGGATNGCPFNVIFLVQQAVPQSAAGNPTTTLVGPSNNVTPYATINAGFVPAKRQTWAQLKSLYR